MLVLTRRRDEVIMIGDDIEVTVVDIREDKVRLGIKAPKHIGVHRQKTYLELKAEEKARRRGDAATGAPCNPGAPGQAPPSEPQKLTGLVAGTAR